MGDPKRKGRWRKKEEEEGREKKRRQWTKRRKKQNEKEIGRREDDGGRGRKRGGDSGRGGGGGRKMKDEEEEEGGGRGDRGEEEEETYPSAVHDHDTHTLKDYVICLVKCSQDHRLASAGAITSMSALVQQKVKTDISVARIIRSADFSSSARPPSSRLLADLAPTVASPLVLGRNPRRG
ncbi:hypothetical protein B296_00002926 [Ensete ventricosum]|uniref:Uncharacterized protein n=1 Tax=Ensete ventricosum TaxID=4639 RepID=A0A427B3A2_ENSVE|nr:hypothetical protein B296_00002926 [Ensete ventricosum]